MPRIRLSGAYLAPSGTATIIFKCGFSQTEEQCCTGIIKSGLKLPVPFVGYADGGDILNWFC